MTDSDNPTTGAAGSASDAFLTQDAAIEKLAGILDADPANIDRIIPKEEGQDKPEDEESEGDAETPDDDPETEESEDEAEDEAEAEAIELADETEIDLGDGRATLKELKEAFKSASLQRADYTRKTQAVSEDRKMVEEKAQEVVTRAQQLQQERETLLAIAQEVIGQPPQKPAVSAQDDPFAWVQYSSEKEAYEERLGKFREVKRQSDEYKARIEADQAKELPKIVERERAKLFERFPKLKDHQTAAKYKAEMLDMMTRVYGFDAEQVANLADSRAVHMALDLIEYHKIKAALPTAKAKVETKPPLVKAAKRASPEHRKNVELQSLRERHAKSGRRDDAVAILKALDL
jgi:ribosomal protein L17